MTDETYLYDYPGAELTARWDGRLCIHVSECTRAHGAVFKSGRSPWGEPDRASVEDAAAIVERCPTGALTYVRADGISERPPTTNTVAISNKGPLYFHGDLTIAGAPADAPGLKTRAALCRCGQSNNKPFCDNAHEGAEFRDRGAVGERGEPLAEAQGALSVRPLPDGPLLVTGPLTILSSSGRPAWTGEKTALCRCGESSKKPFCDGTHVVTGFTAEGAA